MCEHLVSIIFDGDNFCTTWSRWMVLQLKLYGHELVCKDAVIKATTLKLKVCLIVVLILCFDLYVFKINVVNWRAHKQNQWLVNLMNKINDHGVLNIHQNREVGRKTSNFWYLRIPLQPSVVFQYIIFRITNEYTTKKLMMCFVTQP